MKTNPLIIALLVFVGLMCMNSCTKVSTGSLCGKVVLENDSEDPANDPVDYSGITVALYEIPELDTTITRINTEYPQTGVQISTETQFDHRDYSPLRSTQTTGDGSYSITDIDPGIYVLVLLKELWGIRYICSVSIEKAVDSDLGIATLYPEKICESYTEAGFNFLADHTYHVNQISTTFMGAVSVEPKAQIYVEPGCSVRFMGSVAFPGESDINNAWVFKAAKNMYDISGAGIEPADYYSSVEFQGASVDIKNGVFRHLGNAVLCSGNSNEVSDVIVQYCGAGLMFNSGPANVHNSIICNGNSMGININSTTIQGVNIESVVVLNMGDAVFIYTNGSYNISNCYFFGNNYAIRPYYSTGTISNNAFEENRIDIHQYGVSVPTVITYNDFFYSRSLGVFPRGGATINHNNFYRTGRFFISLRAPGSPPDYSCVSADVDGTNNYWGVDDIDPYLDDAHNTWDYPDEPCGYYVIYNPRTWQTITGAGIQ